MEAGSQAATTEPREGEKPFGPVAAVFIAAGIGALVLGILTTLAEASEGVSTALSWSKSVGPLMGKTLTGSLAFFVSWGILYALWKDKDPRQKGIWVWTVILIAAGLLLTFPIFFQLFE